MNKCLKVSSFTRFTTVMYPLPNQIFIIYSLEAVFKVQYILVEALIFLL